MGYRRNGQKTMTKFEVACAIAKTTGMTEFHIRKAARSRKIKYNTIVVELHNTGKDIFVNTEGGKYVPLCDYMCADWLSIKEPPTFMPRKKLEAMQNAKRRSA